MAELLQLRGFMASSGADVWRVIDEAILLAAADCPAELRARRDGIAERLFTSCSPSAAAAAAAEPVAERPEGEGAAAAAEADPAMDPEQPVAAAAAAEAETAPAAAVASHDCEGLEDEMEAEAEQLRRIAVLRDRLTDSRQEEPDLLDALQELEAMPMSVEALRVTEVGLKVRLLRKHSSKRVREAAKLILRLWKDIVLEFLGSVDAIKSGSPPPGEQPLAVSRGTEESEEKHLQSLPSALPELPLDPHALLDTRTAEPAAMAEFLRELMEEDISGGSINLATEEDLRWPTPGGTGSAAWLDISGPISPIKDSSGPSTTEACEAPSIRRINNQEEQASISEAGRNVMVGGCSSNGSSGGGCSPEALPCVAEEPTEKQQPLLAAAGADDADAAVAADKPLLPPPPVLAPCEWSASKATQQHLKEAKKPSAADGSSMRSRQRTPEPPTVGAAPKQKAKEAGSSLGASSSRAAKEAPHVRASNGLTTGSPLLPKTGSASARPSPTKVAAPQADPLCTADERLAKVKRKLHERYQELENAKKQRVVQVMELTDLPQHKGAGGPRRMAKLPPPASSAASRLGLQRKISLPTRPASR
eukprot:SM000084S23124  [mRNA]  locus=s84:327417:330613:+ [translate_table: standard]